MKISLRLPEEFVKALITLLIGTVVPAGTGEGM